MGHPFLVRSAQVQFFWKREPWSIYRTKWPTCEVFPSILMAVLLLFPMQTKERIDIASKQLDRVLSFFARVEAKASFIFAVNSALLTLIALNLHWDDFQKWYVIVPAGLGVILIVISMYFVFRSYFPSLKGGSNSLIYFREIAKCREAEYVDQARKIEEDELIGDLNAQTWRNSEILTAKYDAIKIAFILTALSLIPWFVFLVSVAISHPQVPVVK